MGRRMRGTPAHLLLLLPFVLQAQTFIPGVDGPVSNQEALEGGNTTLLCDSSTDISDDELMLLVWYRNNAPIYSYDARVEGSWSSESYNSSGRLSVILTHQPTALVVTALREDDQALYHCRVDFLLAPTRNIGVNLTVTVVPSKPFFLDEVGNKVEERIGPYHEGDTLVLSCLVIGGRPPPRISWYSGETLVDASDGVSDIPGVRENELYLPLTRDNVDGLSCRAYNTRLAPPISATLKIELYLPAYNVSLHWVRGTFDGTLQSGRSAVVKCEAYGSHPPPDLAWWLDHKHLTQHSNQSWIKSRDLAVSYLELRPGVADNGATLSCIATNSAMAPSRGSRADVIKLNVTYSPIVEVSRVGVGALNEVIELDSLRLECEVNANPPVNKFTWYFNDNEIKPGSIWGDNVTSNVLSIEEMTRAHAGRYSCAAANGVGETRADDIPIIVYYPPECSDHGITLRKETVHCNVLSLPAPDTYFWHVQPVGLVVQHLTTGSPILPLMQITGPLMGALKASCEASNGVSSQLEPCERNFSLEHLRPQNPQQCDLAYEYEEFQMRCIPVENATYYELSVWRMSTSNASLVLSARRSMGFGSGGAVAAQAGPGAVQSGTAGVETRPSGARAGWLVRATLGSLHQGDEVGAAACNRYGCSPALLLKPTNILLNAASPPWWQFFLEKDVGISVGAVVLVAVFIISTSVLVKIVRRPRVKTPAPIIQVLQLDEVARDYIESIGDHKVHASCSLRSCSSVYSDASGEVPAVDRRRKPRSLLDQPWNQRSSFYETQRLNYGSEQWQSREQETAAPRDLRVQEEAWDKPPPDVTLTLHRESAV